MYSRTTDPATGATITRRSEKTLLETVAIEACDTVDFTVAELRDLATMTQHLPDATPVLLIDGDGHDRSIRGLLVHHTRDLDSNDPEDTRLDMIERLARQIVADYLDTRFISSDVSNRTEPDAPERAESAAIVARANQLIAAVADAFRKSAR